MSNRRIYPPFLVYNHLKNNILNINHDETYKSAYFNDEDLIEIKDKGHSRAIRRKTGFKEVITGDIFIKKLYWNGQVYVLGSKKTGMAIIRNNWLIWYSIPGLNKNTIVRKVLLEKTKKTILIPFLDNIYRI